MVMDQPLINIKKAPKPKTGATILVLGATGFIGGHLARLLQTRGYRVRLLSRQAYNPNSLSNVPKSEWMVGSILDTKSLREACSGVQAVFHLANIAHATSKNVDEVHRINVKGTKALKSVCMEMGVAQLIYFSSILAVCPNTSTYAESKMRAEELLLEGPASPGEELHITILRPASVYGTGMKGNIKNMIGLIKKGYLPPLPRLQNEFPLVSVQELCEFALSCTTIDRESGQVFTLTDGEIYTPNRVEDAIYKALNQTKAKWQTPRIFFLLGALSAQFANALGIWSSELGLSTYYNLTADRSTLIKKTQLNEGFVPHQTFESMLSRILEAS